MICAKLYPLAFDIQIMAFAIIFGFIFAVAINDIVCSYRFMRRWQER